MANTVAIVGRPNVGKSTLFNRLIGERKAIVDDQSGITRDRQYGLFDWNGREFIVIDTGGFVEKTDDVFEKAIKDQVRIAIEECDLILFVVDINTGVTDLDQDMAKILRQSDKPTLLCVNKVDNPSKGYENAEFYNLGIDSDLYNISAMTGSGSGDLLDEVVRMLPPENDPVEEELPKFCIVGRPNAGKSSFLNALLGYERSIVTDIAGTTRDTIHTKYNKFDREFLLVDTAGIRKKKKVHENIEFYSVMRAVNAIEESDVVFVVLDATRGLESQDLSIFALAAKRSKGVVILVNKWDLVDKDTMTSEMFKKAIKEKVQPFDDVPIIFMSALTKQRIMKAIDTGIEVFENRSQKIPTSHLNEWLQYTINKNHPPSVKGKYVRIKYCTQVKSDPPGIAFFTNFPKYVKDSYKRYLENELREAFHFEGVPVQMFFREK